MSPPPAITAAVLEKIVAFLAPLFLSARTTDIAVAGETAIALLAGYGARTNRELRLAALSIAFGLGALDALSRAANPDLALNAVIRLRSNANALSRSAKQNDDRLEKLQKDPPALAEAADIATVAPDLSTDLLPASGATADLLAFARSKLKSMMNAATPSAPVTATVVPQSRQQRRATERKAEKVRRRQQEDARLAARTAERAARVPAPQSV